MPTENLCQGTLNTIAGILRGTHPVTELTLSPRNAENPTSLAGWWGFRFTDRIGS
jgi:hypothetical protein